MSSLHHGIMKSCCEPVVTRVRVTDLHDWAGQGLLWCTAGLTKPRILNMRKENRIREKKKQLGGLERVRTLLENMTAWLRQEKTPCWRSVDAQGARNFF